MSVLRGEEIPPRLILEPAALLHETVLIQMILFILPVRPAAALHPISRIKYRLVAAGCKAVRHNQGRIILKLIIHIYSRGNPRHFAVGSILPERRAAVILKRIRILRNPLVVADIADLIPEHIPAGINHRVVTVCLNDRAEGIDQFLKLRLRHILVTGRLHIKNDRVIYRVVANPLYKLVRLGPRLIGVCRVGIKIYACPQSGCVRTAHICIKIRVNS